MNKLDLAGRFKKRAFSTPTTYSDSLEHFLEDLDLANLRETEVLDFFSGTTLDIGSGVEGFGRGLSALAKKRGRVVTTISLNPQFADWTRGADNQKVYKDKGIRRAMAETDEFTGEYISDHRLALCGVAQFLPLSNASCDKVVSTWAFPGVFDEFGGSNDDYELGYREILRVLGFGGQALLGPLNPKGESLAVLDSLQPIYPHHAEFTPWAGEQSSYFNNSQLLTIIKS